MGLKINGSYITDIPLTRNWNKSVFSIDGRHIKQGFNEILLEWPDLQLEENDIINETVHRLEVEGQTDWYPVFGEVFSFLVKSSK